MKLPARRAAFTAMASVGCMDELPPRRWKSRGEAQGNEGIL
jgi:hypothetical protein